jgi:hypothetical protein
MNIVLTTPLATPKRNVLPFPLRVCERETDSIEQTTPQPLKPTLSVKDDNGNIYQYRSELDDFRAAENELFDYNFRRARDGKLLAPDGSKIECLECEGGKHRAKVRLVEADAATGSTATKLDSGFPVLSAIRKKDGNIVQECKGDNRRAFEIIAQLLRSDFSEANREYLSRSSDGIYFEYGEVDFSKSGKNFPSAIMTVAHREKTSVEIISHEDPKTGEVWKGEVPCFVDDGVRQTRGERLAWTWLDLEVSPHQYNYKKHEDPRISDGPAIFHSDTPILSTVFTHGVDEDGKIVKLEWVVAKQRKTRTTRTGTSIWHEAIRTPVGHSGSQTKELKLIRQTMTSVVDNNAADPRRDTLNAETRFEPRYRLKALKDCLGPEMFVTAKMAFHRDMDMGEIADTMGLGTRGTAAVAREIRIVCLQAMRLYKRLANKVGASATTAANENQPGRQMAA